MNQVILAVLGALGSGVIGYITYLKYQIRTGEIAKQKEAVNDIKTNVQNIVDNSNLDQLVSKLNSIRSAERPNNKKG